MSGLFTCKRILLGFGLGLILAGFLTALTPRAVNAPSREEVERMAREFGMIYREEIIDFAKTDSGVVRDIGETPEEEEKAREGPPATFEVKESKVTIPSGAGSERIASILKNNKIIGSENEFLKRVEEKKLASKLAEGEHYSPAEQRLMR